jgi:hypothetical protein
MLERLEHMKKCLVEAVEHEMHSLGTADAKELGEVVDMIKDLEEAIYYCTITKAMNQKDNSRDMDRAYGRMYSTGEEWMYGSGGGHMYASG